MYSKKIIGRMFNFDKIANNHLLILNIAKSVMNEYRESNLKNYLGITLKSTPLKIIEMTSKITG